MNKSLSSLLLAAVEGMLFFASCGGLDRYERFGRAGVVVGSYGENGTDPERVI